MTGPTLGGRRLVPHLAAGADAGQVAARGGRGALAGKIGYFVCETTYVHIYVHDQPLSHPLALIYIHDLSPRHKHTYFKNSTPRHSTSSLLPTPTPTSAASVHGTPPRPPPPHLPLPPASVRAPPSRTRPASPLLQVVTMGFLGRRSGSSWTSMSGGRGGMRSLRRWWSGVGRSRKRRRRTCFARRYD